MYICLYAYMFVIMWMCFSCRYTAYLYHFASTWRDMRAFVMTLTDNHVWTRHFYPHDCRSLHHEHIFDALICCAMCIDSLLDLIWFDLYGFGLIDAIYGCHSLIHYVHSSFSRFSCISTGKDSLDGGRDQIEGWCEELGGGGVELSHDDSNWCMFQQLISRSSLKNTTSQHRVIVMEVEDFERVITITWFEGNHREL